MAQEHGLGELLTEVARGRITRRELVTRAAALGASAPVLTGLLAAQSGEVAAQEAAEGATFNFAMGTYPIHFDPAEGVWGPHYILFLQTYEGLVAYKLGTAELQPALAESWDISEDATSYTFHLRPDVTFHDGSPLTADDVKTSFERIIAVEATPASYLSNVESVVVQDPMTVQVVLKEPSHTSILGFSRVYVHKLPAGAEEGADTWFLENVNGTGPFKVAEAIRDDRLVLERHEPYWQGWPEGSLGRIVMRIVPETATAKLMLESGEVDMATYYTIGPDEPLEAYAEKGLKTQTDPGFRTFIVNMNTRGGRTADLNFRKAIAYAFPYEEYREVFYGMAEVPSSFLPPGFPGNDPERPEFAQDLDKAREHLALADVTGPITITMLHAAAEEQGRRMALLLQDALRELDIELRLEPVSSTSVYEAAIERAETDEAVEFHGHFLLSPLTADSSQYLRNIFGSSFAGTPFNWSLYQNPEFDDLLAGAGATEDPTEREAIWRQAEDLLVRDQPVIFASWATPVPHVLSSRVAEYIYHPMEYSSVPHLYPVRIADAE